MKAAKPLELFYLGNKDLWKEGESEKPAQIENSILYLGLINKCQWGRRSAEKKEEEESGNCVIESQVH